MAHFQAITTDSGSLDDILSTANGLLATKYLAGMFVNVNTLPNVSAHGDRSVGVSVYFI